MDKIDIAEVEQTRELALGQIEFARSYTLELLDNVNTPHERWFEVPSGSPTHIAWQVGHLVYSQYGLLMFRLRGRDPDDLELVPSTFRKKYGRGTVPDSDPEGQPTPADLLDRLNRVHAESFKVVRSTPMDEFLEEIDMPYAVYPNKLGAVLFCPLHEHIHAGQIGLTRRLLGLQPVR